jgi:MYXO-CTERM domain-containing protein
MKNAIAIVALAGMTGMAGAEVVANWGFNNQGLDGGGFGFQVSDFPQNADVGSGMFTVGNFNDSDTGGVYDWVQSFAGTTTLAIDGVSGGSFAFQGAANENVTNNGAQATFRIDGSDWNNLSIDFARRGTSTGFNLLTIEVFVDGDSFGIIDTIAGAQSSTWTSNSYDLSAVDGLDAITVVFTFDGATSNTGNNRLDNVTISGTAVPAPGAFALLGLGGLIGARRRRA